MNGNQNERVLYEAYDFPVSQNTMYETREEAKRCRRGDISLVQDTSTGLVYNQAFRPELVTYDRHYQNEQAVSEIFREHLEIVAEIVGRTMGRGKIVEIGCGKGHFLEMLISKGFDVTGFDPAYEGKSTRVVKRYFNSSAGIRSNGIVLRHVLEHIQDPLQFLELLCDASGGSGQIYIEVPCFDWIRRKRAWFDIFYEHVNYFRLADFYRIFGRVAESGRLFNGQYLYVVADLESLSQPEFDSEDRADFPQKFKRHLETDDLSSTNTGRRVIWGGASKGVIFALLRERAGKPVDFVIDINPAKQGKFMPVTGLKVHSPSDAFTHLSSDDTIYVMNSNYLEEIKRMASNKYQYIVVDHG